MQDSRNSNFTTYALTFSPSAPQRKAAVAAWISAEKSTNDISVQPPERVKVNPEFLELVFSVIKAEAAEDPSLQTLAAYQGTGHLPVVDSRSEAPYCRTAEPQDTLGLVNLHDGKIESQSFVPMREAYRLVTAEGIMQLDDFMHAKLLDRLQRL